MTAFFSGLLLGLAMILPIGVQNLFVLNQGLLVGLPRVLIAACAAASCDTLLILAGAAGASALVTAVPGLRTVLIGIGAAFLTILGMRTVRLRPETTAIPVVTTPRSMVLQAAGVSLLNPHAILDTVGIMGGAIAAQTADERLYFAVGGIGTSWLWFIFLASAAAMCARWLTSTTRLWLHRGSGALMLVFAVGLFRELL